MDQEKIKKMIDAAKMYYFMDCSQQDIADKLGVSRPTVSRFLQQAREDGLVQIRILDPSEDTHRLAYQLKDKYRLKKAIVVPVPHYEEDLIGEYLAEDASRYLDELITDGDTIALAWGETIYQVAHKLNHKHVSNVNVVQWQGGVSQSGTNTYSCEIMHLFGSAYHTSPYFLPLPVIVDHPLVKQAIESERHMRAVLDMGEQANIALYSVGVPVPNSPVLPVQYFTEEEVKELAGRACGEIGARFYDADGRICLPELDARTIGIPLDSLARKEHSILVAGGPGKVEAIFGALQGGYANVLITDQFTAKSLADKEKEYLQPEGTSSSFPLSGIPLY
ncbi:sugar-binding transcriptional regulator [Paenibacillus thiaminolyticus]|uniref:Sugar-binding transcriptional regulator n=1 Tax=Paenibacillus thiaminolyticus TaxID=49283 RepID=A0AAP9DU45_PANTH|nr:sugar-binding transcriptional regulator [Paenibacillus thiaminolyticus]MCY9537615.1 sugar-binding transcriptional regulator [Paenibacillus thiaminolyticus]MCY9600728.1 sugar-binding transcriptional regulator [Paenibacillus thiaminolyticus]MCY9607556.1 sugar-binding transcriptional regulator [Paenibacillus thiaminolyticus]MCY9611356.1 sugar-binding transcriptional regulator [Paenibacillus thiaminolyticus]MCY9617373.1 sugar-binding transcriptional regulator [Paenibacillus thiaminolyticus]